MQLQETFSSSNNGQGRGRPRSRRGRPRRLDGNIFAPISLDNIFEQNEKIMQIDDFSKIPIFFMELTRNMSKEQLDNFKREQISDDPKMWAHLKNEFLEVGEDRKKMFWMVLLEKTARVLFWSPEMIKEICVFIILYDQLKSGKYKFPEDFLKSIIEKVKKSDCEKLKKLLNDKNEKQRKECENFLHNLVKCFEEWESHFELFK